MLMVRGGSLSVASMSGVPAEQLPTDSGRELMIEAVMRNSTTGWTFALSDMAEGKVSDGQRM